MAINTLKHSLIPAGTIIQYAGATEPTDWLFCDGRAVSRTTFAQLFAAIGTTYGSGDGNTTFNLPDMRGRFPLGCGEPASNTVHAWGDNLTYNGVNIYNEVLGNRGGESMHTLNINQMPSHGHGYRIIGDSSQTSSSSVARLPDPTWDTKFQQFSGGVIQDTGGGQAHNNMPPYSTVNFLIYVGSST